MTISLVVLPHEGIREIHLPSQPTSLSRLVMAVSGVADTSHTLICLLYGPSQRRASEYEKNVQRGALGSLVPDRQCGWCGGGRLEDADTLTLNVGVVRIRK